MGDDLSKIAKVLVNPVSALVGEGTKKVGEAVGVDAGVTDVVGDAVGGSVGTGTKAAIDFGVNLKKTADRTEQAGKDFRETQAKQNADALKQVKDRKAQEKAQRKASEDLTAGRAKQARRRKGAGRKGTILTDSLGGVGGEDNQGRKTLLGL